MFADLNLIHSEIHIQHSASNTCCIFCGRRRYWYLL